MTALLKPRGLRDYVSANVYSGTRKVPPADVRDHLIKAKAAIQAGMQNPDRKNEKK